MHATPLPSWCRIVREPEALHPELKARPGVKGPQDAAAIVTARLSQEEVEVFAVVLLDARHQVMAMQEVTRGLVDSSLVHPREVFRLAIAMGASALILAHNHPSGALEPSMEDRTITRQLVEAGRLLDLPVHDHLIIGGTDYLSFAERGWI